jgi:hypothetical protein
MNKFVLSLVIVCSPGGCAGNHRCCLCPGGRYLTPRIPAPAGGAGMMGVGVRRDDGNGRQAARPVFCMRDGGCLCRELGLWMS